MEEYILVLHFTDCAPIVAGFDTEQKARDFFEEDIKGPYRLGELELITPSVPRDYLYAHNKDLSIQAYIMGKFD